MPMRREKGSKGKVLPEESNPLDQDLRLYDHLSERGRDPHVREFFARLANLIRGIQSFQPFLSEVAEKLGIQKMCGKLSSAEIVFFIALPSHDGETKIHRLLREHLVEPNIERFKKIPGWNRETFLDFLSMVFTSALRREYVSRRLSNESEHGRYVRELLVDEKSRGVLLQKLGREIARGLFFRGESRWESEDAPGEAIVGIWQKISEFARVSPVAADPAALRAFMQGDLNNVLEQTRRHVRTVTETEDRRGQLFKDDPEFPSEGPTQQVLVESVCDQKSRRDDRYNKVLCEQLLSTPGLTAKDRELVWLRFYEGYTEEEAATRLGLSQAQVSKSLKRILASLKRQLQSPAAPEK